MCAARCTSPAPAHPKIATGTRGLGPCSHPRPEARDLPSSRRVLWVLAARNHPQPSQPQGDGAVGAPQDPCFWGQLHSQRGATCSHDRGTRHRIALLAGARQLCPPFAPSSPSPHPQRPSPSGGRGCRRGRELCGVPGSASSPRCWRGGRGSRRRRPQPSTSSPSPTSPPCFFPLVSSLAGFTWGTFLKC